MYVYKGCWHAELCVASDRIFFALINKASKYAANININTCKITKKLIIKMYYYVNYAKLGLFQIFKIFTNFIIM